MFEFNLWIPLYICLAFIQFNARGIISSLSLVFFNMHGIYNIQKHVFWNRHAWLLVSAEIRVFTIGLKHWTQQNILQASRRSEAFRDPLGPSRPVEKRCKSVWELSLDYFNCIYSSCSVKQIQSWHVWKYVCSQDKSLTMNISVV